VRQGSGARTAKHGCERAEDLQLGMRSDQPH
jgi:hypothetical protein